MVDVTEWYTRQQVADLLNVSKATVYQYAKQKKIIKILDPHRLYKEARYQKVEVDSLVEERKLNQPNGMKPAELAKKLNVPLIKIYRLIKDHDLPVDEYPLGDEMIGYSISDSLVEWITDEINRTMPVRAATSEFFDSVHDVVIYQLFKTPSGQELRLVRNEENEWGFYLQSRSWIPVKEALTKQEFVAVYSIHKKNLKPNGYTDFELPKGQDESFLFLDFAYQTWGIENVRLREHEDYLALSIKSGDYEMVTPIPTTITQELLQSYLTFGKLLINEDNNITLISGYKRTTVELPTELLAEIQEYTTSKGVNMSTFLAEAAYDKLRRRD